jgi:hypothetical protein
MRIIASILNLKAGTASNVYGEQCPFCRFTYNGMSQSAVRAAKMEHIEAAHAKDAK